jgi:hypothetical protein
MKEPEYVGGPEARENLERGMIALFKVPQEARQASRGSIQSGSSQDRRDYRVRQRAPLR